MLLPISVLLDFHYSPIEIQNQEPHKLGSSASKFSVRNGQSMRKMKSPKAGEKKPLIFSCWSLCMQKQISKGECKWLHFSGPGASWQSEVHCQRLDCVGYWLVTKHGNWWLCWYFLKHNSHYRLWPGLAVFTLLSCFCSVPPGVSPNLLCEFVINFPCWILC